MVIKFAVSDWRSIMRICGSITATCTVDRITCRYILLRFESDGCVAYGSNGSQITRISVPCKCFGVPSEFHLMIMPMKVPAHTRYVEIDMDNENEKDFTVTFLDEFNDIVDAMIVGVFDGQPMDYEYFYKKAMETIDQYGCGEGKYSISVNPKYLMNALEGFKSCDHVIINFAGKTDPFIIRPYDDSDTDAVALVYPVRML